VPTKLVGPAEIGIMLGGLSRQRVYQLTSRGDFPEPVAVLSNGKVWNHSDVRAWAKRNGRAVHAIPDSKR
jgi:prophage regulatory protein